LIPAPWSAWSKQVDGSAPNLTRVALHVLPAPTSAVTVAFMTLPDGAEVLVTPSIVAASVVIRAPAAPGQAPKATPTTTKRTRTLDTVPRRSHPSG
jgi:hypothetical protein